MKRKLGHRCRLALELSCMLQEHHKMITMSFAYVILLVNSLFLFLWIGEPDSGHYYNFRYKKVFYLLLIIQKLKAYIKVV